MTRNMSALNRTVRLIVGVLGLARFRAKDF